MALASPEGSRTEALRECQRRRVLEVHLVDHPGLASAPVPPNIERPILVEGKAVVVP
jgi:hypothetical protein